MMVHRIVVEDQSLRWYGRSPKIADNSIEFVQFQFHLPEEWASLLIVAQFTQSETYNMLVSDDRCFLPVELKAGICQVSLFGYSEGKPVRATSIPLVFQIEESGFVSSAETPIPPTPDLYTQLIEYFSSIAGSGGGGSGSGTINPEDIAAAVEDYLSKNPPEVPDLSDEVERAETAAQRAESANSSAQAALSGAAGAASDANTYAQQAQGFSGSASGSAGFANTRANDADAAAAKAKEAASDAEAAADRAEEAAKVTTDLDTTLTQAGKAADAKAVGDAISKLSGGNVTLIGTTDDVSPAEVALQMYEGKPFAITHTDSTYGRMVFDSFAYVDALQKSIVASVVFQAYGKTACVNLYGFILEGIWDFQGFLLATPDDIPDSGGNVAYDEAQNLTDKQKAQARENIGAQPAGNYLTEVPEGYAKTEDIPEAYTLPVATTTTLGGVKPTITKSEVMTQPVAVDENGGMWTTAAASGTVLVAASDAPDAIKAAAQYVCTGVNDQLMINAAIETVGAGEVRLSGGNFYLTGGIIPKDRIILYGRNSVLNVCDEISSTVTQAYTAGDTVVHVADASVFVLGQKVSTDAGLYSYYRCFIVDIDIENNTVTLDAPLSATKGFDANTYRLIADFTVVQCLGLSNVTVEGLVINGNGDSYGFYDTSYGGNGILFREGCTECKAINCTVNEMKCHGILVSGCGQCQVLNCVVDNCKRLGFDILGGDGGHLVHGCIAKYSATGFQGHNVKNTIFSSCTAIGCGFSAQEQPDNVVITGCEIYGGGGIICVAGGAKTLNIVGNIIIGASQDGIQLDATGAVDCCIAHNIIKGSRRNAINLIGVNGFSIVGNHISDCLSANTATEIDRDAAIRISGAAKSGYVADNNIILTTTDTKGCPCGIAEHNLTGDNNVVVNNVIRGARIAATQKLGENSVFENNYEF